MEFKIQEKEAQELMQYLAAKPWAEVHKHMVVLSNLKPAKQPRKVKTPNKV